MFSVTKTEVNVFPLCTRNVWPTKSGVTIERRDQVLIGFLAPDAFILSIFSSRCDSTKGPFFSDLAINCKSFVIDESRFEVRKLLHKHRVSILILRFLLRPSPFQNESVARLMLRARLKTFRQLSPWADRMMATAATFRFPLTTTHRMIDGIHHHTSDMRPAALPASASRLAARDIHVIDVTDLPNRGVSLLMNPANLAGGQLDQGIAGFAVIQSSLLAGAARNLAASTGVQLNVVNIPA